MPTTPTELPLIDELLSHSLSAFTHQLGLTKPPPPLNAGYAAALLNYAERLSRSSARPEQIRCLLICGLLWEHRDKEWAAAPGFIMNLLSRIRLAPSMQMVDPEYAEFRRHQSMGSISLEAAIAARSLEHQIEVADSRELTLSGFQKDVWDALSNHRRVGISAPTSAGKSYVLLYKALDILAKENGFIVYIVPTLSLIQQVTTDFNMAIAELGLSGVQVTQTYSTIANSLTRRIYVLTQERALSALSKPDGLRGARLVIVDEVQNLERISGEDDERSQILLDVLQEIVSSRQPQRVVLSGPRVENIQELTKQLLGEDAHSVEQTLPPVLNVTYAFRKTRKSVAVRQYVQGVARSTEVPVDMSAVAASSIFGKKRYSPEVTQFIARIIRHTPSSEATLVFSPTSKQATKTAMALAEHGVDKELGPGIPALREYIIESVHPNYALNTTLPGGLGYHHGKMPQHIRIAVEDCFKNSELKVLACTTTLMQGVNLPAKNIIARNPNLFINRRARSSTLTAYEFANLRGRAGRLLKDFVGRAIVLDEQSFDSADVGLDFPEKTVTLGYGPRFDAHRPDVVSCIRNSESVAQPQPYNDLVTHIRQMAIRHGSRARDRLEAAGIALASKDFAMVLRQVRALGVPVSACGQLPYWDPFVLEEIYRAHRSGELPQLPTNPLAKDLGTALKQLLGSMRRLAPYYFSKYLGDPSPREEHAIVSMAKAWCREKPLISLLEWDEEEEAPDWETIDFRLDRLSRLVVFQLPRLLKPVAVMQGEDSPLLSMIEFGAYSPSARRLIELGLAREPAVRICQQLPERMRMSDDARTLLVAAERRSRSLNLWEKRQIESVTLNKTGVASNSVVV